MPTQSISRCGGSTTGFFDAVFTIAATRRLLAYWTLCEGATPYLDTSGFSPATPATMVLQANTTPMTQDFTHGPLAAGDCGAVGFNVDGWVGGFSPSEYLFANTVDSRFDGSPLSVCTFVRLGAAVNTFNGGICGNLSMAAGVPNYQVGMGFYALYPSRVVRFSNGSHSSGAAEKFVATPGSLVADTWYFLAGTWNGATLTFYVNGASVGTTADAGAAYTLNNGYFIGRMNIDGIFGSMYGQTAQTTVWKATLSATEIGTLATAAGY